jgi:hypothetical protein
MNLFRISKPIRKVSKHRKKRSGKPGKLGIVRVVGKDMEAVRREVFERDGYRCQHDLGDGVICLSAVVFERGEWNSGHLAHIRAKRNNGDLASNLLTKCIHCHLVLEHNPKSVPPKVKP